MWNVSRFTRRLPSFHFPDVTPYRRFLGNELRRLDREMTSVLNLFRDSSSKAWAVTYPLIGKYRLSLSISLSVTLLSMKMFQYYKTRPKAPQITFNASLNVGKLFITARKIIGTGSKVLLVFCIDRSTSMQWDPSKTQTPEEKVKEGVNQVLETALRMVQEKQGTDIQVGIELFNKGIEKLFEPEMLSETSVEKMKTEVSQYSSCGGTDIALGLLSATTLLETMSEARSDHTPILILLTDGDEEINEEAVREIHKRLSRIEALLFAIGIGKEHRKSTLETITHLEGSFNGTYIDTTSSDGPTIQDAIMNSFKTAVASYTELAISTKDLKGKEWSVDSKGCEDREEGSFYRLGPFDERECRICITRKPDRRIDLKKIRFFLEYTDPMGRKGKVPFHWNPHSVIDQAVLAK